MLLELLLLVATQTKYMQIIPQDFTPTEEIVIQKDFELVSGTYEDITGYRTYYCPNMHVFHIDPKEIRAEYEKKGKPGVLADYLNNKARIDRAGLIGKRKTALIHEIAHHFNRCNRIYGLEDEILAKRVEQALREDLYEATNTDFGMQRP